MTCLVCEDLAFAWASLPLTSAERWEVWRHFQGCEVARANCEAGRMQLAEKGIGDEWTWPAGAPVEETETA